MTTTFKGIEPPLPLGDRSLPPPPPPPPPPLSTRPSFQQPPRSWPRQNSIPDANAPAKADSVDTLEPPLKKPRLEDAAGLQRRTSNIEGISKPAAFDHVASTVPEPGVQRQSIKSPNRAHPLIPLRPGKSQSLGRARRDRPIAIERAGRKDAVPTKAYVPEPPSCAPRYHRAGPADFIPWIGDHPEDALNEVTTKQGFYDKLPPSQNESNTARPSVWSSLKHKSGLQILSSLFVSALDQRQAYGTITANSTFKPPPRVTLTDTKRETWLRDLANPLIPLRRLSRTIPHGIRGRVLLDHCLSKDIPTTRAVWLAKCVGANEIRAFKRKGTGGVFTVGGEAKWIKDWTSNLEQFLESIIASCGSIEWKAKINYGLRLASHLYAEHLLDQDHYIDWLITSFEKSDLDHLPIWLLVQQSHQQEILQHRRRGRRLAAAVLEHLCIANSSDVDRNLYDPVLQQLVQLSRFIMVDAPACFLLPASWARHKIALRECSAGEGDRDRDLQRRYENLTVRNEYLQNGALRQEIPHRNCLRQRIILLLDSLSTKPDYVKVAGACLHSPNYDDDVLIETCVEWSCSIYRYGLFRTYAATRLLRMWHRHGIELQRPLLNVLASFERRGDVSRESLYRLIAGLISSKHISVGRYLQWLMARGSLRDSSNHSSGLPLDAGLLFELPLHGLPSHILNLRQTLVSSSKKAAWDEEGHVTNCTKIQISEFVVDFFSPIPTLTESPRQTTNLIRLSLTVKAEIARWIRQTVIDRVAVHTAVTNSKGKDQQALNSPRNTTDIMSLNQFLRIRQVLEDIGDFNVFADVLDLVSDKLNGSVLTAITDTIHSYIDTFNAIGAADKLFQKLFGYVEVIASQHIEKATLESLIDLGCRLNEPAKDIQKLRRKLSAHAPKLPVVACSPISDTMVEAVQSTESTFADEMDQMLASGTSMDKQTLTRVFETLIGHLEKSVHESSHLVVRLSYLLATLRGFGSKTFDILLNDWLHAWLQRNALGSLSTSLEPLICSKAVTLETVLQASIQLMNLQNDKDYRADLALHALDLISEANSVRLATIEYRRYRLLDQLQGILRKAPMIILTILREVAEARSRAKSDIRTSARSEMKDDAFADLVQRILLQQCEVPDKSTSLTSVRSPNIDTQDAISTILSTDGSIISDLVAFRQEIISIVSSINSFSVCMLRVRLKAALQSTTIPVHDSTRALSEIVIERAVSSQDNILDFWTSLIPELSAHYVSSIGDLAESTALAWAMDDRESTPIKDVKHISGLTSIVQAAALCSPVAETSRLIGRITDNLTNIVQAEVSQIKLLVESDHLISRLEVVLCLLVIHRSAIQHPKYSQNGLIQLLSALSLLGTNPFLNLHQTFSHRIFDILCLLTDSISDDTRMRCIHNLRDHKRVRDPRLHFIFGYSDTDDSEWLQFVTKPSSAAEMRAGGASAVTTARPYPLRRWEMMQDATPVATENDTSLSLTLFGSRNSVL